MIKDDRLPLKEKFLEYFRKAPIQKFAAAYIGRSEDTITDWKREDSDFSDCINRAKADYVSEKLNKVRSNEWILERVFKGDFAQRTELTGKDGQDLLPKPILGGVANALPTNNSNSQDSGSNETN